MAYLGLNIAMGLLRLPQISDYWSKSNVLSTPIFPAILSRDWFQNILHLNDSDGQKKKGESGFDPLYKVRPLLDHLIAVFPSYYHPVQQVSI